jgi:hypothetical protein
LDSNILTLADGTEIDPSTGTPIGAPVEETYVVVPNYNDIQRQIVSARSRIADMPLPPSQMTSIGIVLFYTMIGLHDEDISLVTGLNQDQIGKIRISDSYTTIYQDFLAKVMENDIDDVRSMFVRGSRQAAGKMMSLMNSESENVQMAAAKDILDRAGQRPSDIVEHRHTVDGALRIEYVKKDSADDIPVIEGEVL